MSEGVEQKDKKMENRREKVGKLVPQCRRFNIQPTEVPEKMKVRKLSKKLKKKFFLNFSPELEFINLYL